MVQEGNSGEARGQWGGVDLLVWENAWGGGEWLVRGGCMSVVASVGGADVGRPSVKGRN